jgi:hypothetical protein
MIKTKAIGALHATQLNDSSALTPAPRRRHTPHPHHPQPALMPPQHPRHHRPNNRQHQPGQKETVPQPGVARRGAGATARGGRFARMRRRAARRGRLGSPHPFGPGWCRLFGTLGHQPPTLPHGGVKWMRPRPCMSSDPPGVQAADPFRPRCPAARAPSHKTRADRTPAGSSCIPWCCTECRNRSPAPPRPEWRQSCQKPRPCCGRAPW